MEDKDYFNKICLCRLNLASTPISNDKNFLFFWYRRPSFLWEIYTPFLGRKGKGQKTLPISAVFQLPSAHNNQKAKTAQSGVHFLMPSL